MTSSDSTDPPHVDEHALAASLGLLRIIAGKLGIHAQKSDASPDDAIRFAEELMLADTDDEATTKMQSDPKGIRAFLGMAETPDAALTPAQFQIDVSHGEIALLFAPVCDWIAEASRRRKSRLARNTE